MPPFRFHQTPQRSDDLSLKSLLCERCLAGGSIPFLLINLVVFVFWIVANTVGPKSFQFDLYPFQFLTMVVSLEAIFLSIFVLVSQNRQAVKDRIIADLEMGVMASQLREIERKLHHIHQDLLAAKTER